MEIRIIDFLFIILLSVSTRAECQEIILSVDNPVRDFEIIGDTIVYSQNSQVLIKTINGNTSSYFGGGHILNIGVLPNNNIITLANKYKENHGSVRIYDIHKHSYTHIIEFDNRSPILSYYIDPNDLSKVIVTFNDGELELHNWYGKLDKIGIGNFGLVRDIEIDSNEFFFCSDNGTLFKYSDKITELLHLEEMRFTRLQLHNDKVYISTDNGKLIKFSLLDKRNKIIDISPTIINSMLLVRDQYLVLGDWDGVIYIFDIKLDQLIKQYIGHSSRVLSIKTSEKYDFVSSGADGKIIGWNLLEL